MNGLPPVHRRLRQASIPVSQQRDAIKPCRVVKPPTKGRTSRASLPQSKSILRPTPPAVPFPVPSSRRLAFSPLHLPPPSYFGCPPNPSSSNFSPVDISRPSHHPRYLPLVANMSRAGGRPSNAPPPASARQNEYFVPRDGIDREVITADICRYLGNDALVRPGVYESQNGVVQGYYITAYRNLTTAMIEDLKADSARWDQERRQQSARNTGGVQYRNSDTHQSRQYYGPTEAPNYPELARDPYDSGPRYPGTGNAGYTGAASSSYPAQPYGGQSGYSAQQQYSSAQQPQFSPSAQDSYVGGSMAASSFSPPERPYHPVGANLTARVDTYGASDPYSSSSSRGGIPPSSMTQATRPTYVTSGGPPAAGYTATAGSAPYYSSQQPPSAASQFPSQQPQDPLWGRASPAGATQSAYGSGLDQQYETAPNSRATAPSPSTQMASSGSSRHVRDSVDRHQDSRHRSHRSGHSGR